MGLHKFESRRVQKQKAFADISAIGRSSSRYFHGFRRRPQGGESGLPASFFELHRQIATRGESRMDAFWRYTHKGGRYPWISSDSAIRRDKEVVYGSYFAAQGYERSK